MSDAFDIVIVGGGMVGAALAAMLADTRPNSLSIAVLEPRPPKKPARAFELRVSALSPASRNILACAGAWQRIDARRIAAYHRMQVWDAASTPDRFGSISFDSADLGMRELGFIVENNRIQFALFEQIRNQGSVTLIESGLEQLSIDGRDAVLHLDNGKQARAALVVGADGAASRTRDLVGIESGGWSYEQHAVVANVETEFGHGDTAWQRFLQHGPIALLPLADGRCSIVWSTTPEHARDLCALTEKEFCDSVSVASDYVRGDVLSSSSCASFPLRLRYAKQYCAERVALIGDAAHAVHPLAGQGVNLGLLDAAALCEVIEQGVAEHLAPGDRRLLRRYERWRKGDNALTMMSMDALNRLFGNDDLFVSALRRGGLTLVNRVALIKNIFARYAAGGGANMPVRAQAVLRDDNVSSG